MTNDAAMFSGPTYEQLLNENWSLAMSEGDKFFGENNAVFSTLHKVAKRLNELGVGYCVVGGLALYRYGYRRVTDDVDILVTKADLEIIHQKLSGLGYLPPFERSKQLRDVETRVKIEFLVTGGYPGDGKPKPISFPDPHDVSVEVDGINYIRVNSLIELKIASGLTGGVHRMKDLVDAIELIKTASLPLELADSLNPFVRDEYTRLWKSTRKRFIALWRRNRVATDHRLLSEMQAEGVVVESDEDSGEFVRLVTTDPNVAEKYEFEDEYYHLNGPDDTGPKQS